jgi:hypothetical protein
MPKTIDPEHAADVYALFDDHGVIDENPPLDDNNVAHGWVLLGSVPSRQSRWHEKYWMLLRDADDALWGLEYGVGLTEDQEDDLPWRDHAGPLPLVRLYPHTVTTVEYRTKPAEVAA